MLIAEQWLRHIINPKLSTEELTESLTMAGLEVESVESIAPAFSGIVVARVLECADHENSDHLHVCKVDAGEAEPLQIVCGAPNVRAGILVPCAKIGAVLPGDFKIKKAKMRGVDSFGMLCSKRELGVSDEHDGIWILPETLKVGEDVRTALELDEKRIEIKLTPNRGDALSVLGVARDLRAITGAEMNTPDMSPVEPTCECRQSVRIEAPDLCGRFTGRVIRGLNPKAPTPEWMKRRLERSGQRPISALVDISNYIMLEIGRPTHFFDAKKLSGDVVVRWAKEGETIKLLNNQEVKLDPYYGVVADATGPVAIGGIMGGDACSIHDETTDIFIEGAFWYPEKIQGRCRRLNFSTDAAHRFERGVDFGSHIEHMNYATRLVLEICGTPDTKVGPIDDQCVNLPVIEPVRMRPERCNKLVGIEISEDFMAQAFDRLGFAYVREGHDFVVTPPTYRFDIRIEEDLIEEVARLYGYEKLPDRPPLARVSMLKSLEERRTNHDLRLALVEAGYQELINFSFVPEAWELDFAANEKPIRLLNPIASQLSVMRSQLVGGLVDILKFNLNRKAENVRVFELARVFSPDETVVDSDWTVGGISQPLHVAGLVYGDAHDNQWGEAARPADFFDVKGDVEKLLCPLVGRFTPVRHPALHPGRAAQVSVGGKVVGVLGELHPKLCQKYGLPKAPVVFELDVASLLNVPVPAPKAVSKFQPVGRDVSVLVPANLSVDAIFDAVEPLKAETGALRLESFKLFDLYRPKDDPNAQTSLAFHATLVKEGEEPMSETEADALMQRIFEKLSAVGARLRA